MSDLRKAAQQALDALVNHVALTRPIHETSEAINALRAALQDEGKQEPVAWVNIEAWKSGEYCADDCFSNAPCAEDVPLYTAPPQRPLLTDDEVLDAVRDCGLDWHAGYDLDERNRYEMLARAIERKVRGEE